MHDARNGAESLVHTLLQGGVDVCFTNPGTSEMHFVAALDRIPGMRCVLGLFEGVVTGAADGYYRIAGRPASTLLHLGPGLANGLANLHNARKAGSGIVNVVGEHATDHVALDAPLTSDIEGIARPMSHWVHPSRSADDIAADGARAVLEANAPPGRIATLVLPADTAWNPVSGGARGAGARSGAVQACRTAAPAARAFSRAPPGSSCLAGGPSCPGRLHAPHLHGRRARHCLLACAKHRRAMAASLPVRRMMPEQALNRRLHFTVFQLFAGGLERRPRRGRQRGFAARRRRLAQAGRLHFQEDAAHREPVFLQGVRQRLGLQAQAAGDGAVAAQHLQLAVFQRHDLRLAAEPRGQYRVEALLQGGQRQGLSHRGNLGQQLAQTLCHGVPP